MSRLHRAARLGQDDEIAAYLAAGDAVDAISINGFSALMLAAREGHLSVVRQLLAAGASVDLAYASSQKRRNRRMRASVPMRGRTALDFAAGSGHLTVVRALVESGANVNGERETGNTPALSAAVFNHGEIVAFLKERGADMSRRGIMERTADDWLAVGGLPGEAEIDFGKIAERQRSPERQQRAEEQVLKLMAEGLSADEYAAVHGRLIYVWGYGRDTFADADVQAWAHRVAEVLFTPGLLEECEERFLQSEALDEARKCRARQAQSAARQKRREERLRLKKESA